MTSYHSEATNLCSNNCDSNLLHLGVTVKEKTDFYSFITIYSNIRKKSACKWTWVFKTKILMPLKGCLCWESHTCLSSDDVRNDHRCIQFLWGDDPGTEDRINVYVYNFWIKHLNDEQVRKMWFKKSEINRSLWCSFTSCTVTQSFSIVRR